MKKTDIQRIPDICNIITDSGEVTDARVSFEERGDRLSVYLEAQTDRVQFIAMRWKIFQDSPVRVLGDNWERLQSDTCFRPLGCDRFLPWYFIVTDGKRTDACGVMVQPNSFVAFGCDADGVSGWFDVRCGGVGVDLSGRRLHVADIVSRQYETDSFSALRQFCHVMSPHPILPKEPVYGGNNWYYAYGNSSAEEILDDASLQAYLAGDNAVRPYMVIDDGWQVNSCSGPWVPNEKFGDMKELADKMKEMGVHPGVWVRFLHNDEFEASHPECLIKKDNSKIKETFLDPSHPAVLSLIRDDIARIKSWGFELIKHDYTSYDMFNSFGFNFNGSVNKYDGWSFYDTKKTSAEIVLELYRTIHDACGDTLIIGCNTFSHLCAGLVQINRIGDDTSGRKWDRTRAFGVNTLAFRLPQHGAFYAVDADCAGFLGDNIPWELNSQWVDLLAHSGTPLFISCPNHLLNDEQLEFMKKAYAVNAKQTDVAVPLDWEYNLTPNRWLINGEKREYHWNIDNIPGLLKWSVTQSL